MPYKVNPTTGQLDYYEVAEGGGGGVATNLNFFPSPTTGTITSDSGTDADIPLANSTNSGLFSPSEKAKLAIALTSVGVDYRGAYNNGDGSYTYGSVVLYNGLLYEKISNPNNPGYPPTGADWVLFDPEIGSPSFDLWIRNILDNKVNIEAGKGLSTEDYTTAEQTKLAGIQAGAEVNVNADWNATSGDAQILNKPTIPAAQVNSDWLATSGVAQILNKPSSLPTSNVKHSVKYGVALTIGQAVYVSSADGTNMIVSKADNSSESTSSKTMGLVTASGAANYQGEVITEGLLAGLNTIGATIGDAVWLGTNGNLLFGLSNKPSAPNHLVFIGIVTRVNANNGEIFVKVQNGFEVNELHDVSISGRANNTLLGYDSSTGLHIFKTVAQWLGYTPIDQSIIGSSNGIVPLNSSTKIDQTYLPSYVDDVLEYANTTSFPATGETGKIYIALDTNVTYRWSGSAYVEISSSLALGETSATAYRGDRGKIAYDHSQLLSGNPHNVTKAEVGLGNVPNTDATNPANIVQTSSYRFVTDAEKATWNSSGSLIPDLKGNEVFRGVTFRNNSTTIDTLGGITNTLSGTQGANSVATTNYRTRQVSMRLEPSVVSTGNYASMRCSTALWSITGGFLFTADFGIADSGFATGTHNFWGLTDSTSALAIGGVGNSQPSNLLNIIAVANDSGDANLQFMHNDGTGTATKIDLGASFPSNRTSGAAATAMYNIKIYNPAGSSTVYYKVTNKETGAVAEGSISANLPSTSTLLSYQAGRSMGTSGGGVSGSGRFDVSILGVYNI